MILKIIIIKKKKKKRGGRRFEFIKNTINLLHRVYKLIY